MLPEHHWRQRLPLQAKQEELNKEDLPVAAHRSGHRRKFGKCRAPNLYSI